MSVSDILSRTPSAISNGNIGANVQKLEKDLAAASSGLLNNAKYSSRADLESSGLDGMYDSLQSTIARCAVYEITTTSAETKLTAKKIALEEIGVIMTNVNGDASSDDVSTGITRKEKADTALVKIANILNRRIDGEYIFGGKTSDKAPIEGDITKLNDKNFTKVDPVVELIDVSDNISVDANIVTARDLAPAIEFLNKYKQGSNQDSADKDALQVSWDKFTKTHGLLTVNVGDALQNVKTAKTDNVAVIESANKVLESDFTMNIVDIAQQMSGVTKSLLVNSYIQSASSKLLDKVMMSSMG
jgi:hypothetical protein